MQTTAMGRILGDAQRHHGVVTRRRARQAGVSDATITRWVDAGVLERLAPGVFVIHGWPKTTTTAAQAACDYFGRDAVASRRTAAALLGLLKCSDVRTHLTTNVRSGPSPEWIVLHRTRHFPDHHRAEVDGVPVTSVSRTLLDLCLERISGANLRRATTTALRNGDCNVSQLWAMLEECPHAPRRERLLSVVREMDSNTASTRSELEERFRRLTADAGIPPTAFNHPVVDSLGRLRYLDAVYMPERLPIELDSARFHRLTTDQHDDRQRANSLVLAGWLAPLRYTWWDVVEHGDRVIAEIRTARRTHGPDAA